MPVGRWTQERLLNRANENIWRPDAPYRDSAAVEGRGSRRCSSCLAGWLAGGGACEFPSCEPTTAHRQRGSVQGCCSCRKAHESRSHIRPDSVPELPPLMSRCATGVVGASSRPRDAALNRDSPPHVLSSVTRQDLVAQDATPFSYVTFATCRANIHLHGSRSGDLQHISYQLFPYC